MLQAPGAGRPLAVEERWRRELPGRATAWRYTVRNRWPPSRRACSLHKAPCRRYGSKLPPGFVGVWRSSYTGSFVPGVNLGDQTTITLKAVVFLPLRTPVIVRDGLPVLLPVFVVIIFRGRRRGLFHLANTRLHLVNQPQILVITCYLRFHVREPEHQALAQRVGMPINLLDVRDLHSRQRKRDAEREERHGERRGKA